RATADQETRGARTPASEWLALGRYKSRYICWSLTLSSARQALHYTRTMRGEDAEPHLRASNEGLLRPRVARATEVGVLTSPALTFLLPEAANSVQRGGRSKNRRGGYGPWVGD